MGVRGCKGFAAGAAFATLFACLFTGFTSQVAATGGLGPGAGWMLRQRGSDNFVFLNNNWVAKMPPAEPEVSRL